MVKDGDYQLSLLWVVVVVSYFTRILTHNHHNNHNYENLTLRYLKSLKLKPDEPI